MRAARALAVIALTAALVATSPQYATRADTSTGGTSPSEAVNLPPKLAGARYGQALGASLVCPFIHLMPAADALMGRYSGAELETFKAEAQQVTVVWKKTLGCDPMADINRCRILSEKSCSEAIKEIGLAGTAAKGLIEFRK